MIEQSRFIQAACQARRVYFGRSEVALEIFIVSTKSLGSFGITVVETNPGLKPGHVFESGLDQEGGTFPQEAADHIFWALHFPAEQLTEPFRRCDRP